MDFAPFLIDPQRLWAGEEAWTGPLAIVDCETAREWPAQPVLPPCPVIGLGDRAHPLAATLDTVIEAPVSLAGVVRQIVARPRAAAVVTDLLRLLPSLPPREGLVAESFAYAALQGSQEHLDWRAARAPQAPAIPGALRTARAGELLTLTLDRAAAGNAIDVPLRDALCEALGAAVLDPTWARIRLAARGRCFSLGAELAEFGATPDPATAHAIRRRTLPARLLAELGPRLEALVQGACVGAGLEMAAFASRVLATPDAWFQLPELAMGVLPGAGGCVSVSARIGRQRAALMILSGRRIDARTARSWGLVDALVDELPGDEAGPDIA
ncbi:MAG: enoyl-CoA hydratase/isomerase family protein [Sphingomonadales bacterium]|nr:enoyl-CoA hydratase/isomerase family protein [Sphingomonadales bacterium]